MNFGGLTSMKRDKFFSKSNGSQPKFVSIVVQSWSDKYLLWLGKVESLNFSRKWFHIKKKYADLIF